MATHRVLVAAFPDIEILDVSGPASVFANANAHSRGRPRYELLLAAPEAGPLTTSCGIALHAQRALARAPRTIHTLLVPGGEGTETAARDAAYLGHLRRLAVRASRVVSVCSGTFLLAAAGLLDGRRVTTHWRYAARLAEMFPRVQVEPDAIFVEDGSFWTSAGVTAGLDLALALVERDAGRAAALDTARALVCYLKRPGGQSQFSVPLQSQSAERPVLERIRQHVIERPGADHRLVALADRAHMSERHLRRLFASELGVSPRTFVRQARLEQAQRLLCESDASVREVARRCGYASAEAFARSFESSFKVAPSAFRARFRSPATPSAARYPASSRRKPGSSALRLDDQGTGSRLSPG